MKKLITLLISCILLIPFSTSANDSVISNTDLEYTIEKSLLEEKYESIESFYDDLGNSAINENSKSINYGLTYDDINSLSIEDYEYIYNKIKNDTNKATTEYQKNVYAVSLMKEIVEIKPNNARGGTELNSQEQSLIFANPLQGAAYVIISSSARTSAHNKYTDFSCWYDGNGDAYRHILWSSMLYCEFYMNYGSHDAARATTLMWTNAHEGYSPNEIPSAFDTSLSLEVRMDLYNNLIGMLLGEIRIDLNSYQWEELRDRAEIWTDNGEGKQIGVDYYNQRVLVPTTNADKK